MLEEDRRKGGKKMLSNGFNRLTQVGCTVATVHMEDDGVATAAEPAPEAEAGEQTAPTPLAEDVPDAAMAGRDAWKVRLTLTV